AKSTRLPSGVHPLTRSAPGWYVSRLGTPPAAGTTYTSVLPSYSPVKAIIVPSGEKIGLVSTPIPVVRRLASPPARSAIHRSRAELKTTLEPLTVGFCSKVGASVCAKMRVPARVRSRSARIGAQIRGQVCAQVFDWTRDFIFLSFSNELRPDWDR